jgi:hypothetical protein
VSEKPKTRAELEAKIAEIEATLEGEAAKRLNLRNQVDAAIAREKEARGQFDDLKQRLVTAEADNQRMRGYIARVQEDDVVREDLIATGDPAGEQQLVPKRKATIFGEPSPYMTMTGQMTAGLYARSDRPPPKHWVTY